ncbi:MAG: hypothetical protein HQL37_03270 [Alphaproteobacteria bacterium]|nr:hypothetical protein [Alphaproteobacteria bacterium]
MIGAGLPIHRMKLKEPKIDRKLLLGDALMWTAQKVALWALLDAIRGPITIQAMMRMTGEAYKSFANAP